MTSFTEKNIIDSYGKKRLSCDRSELVYSPLWWHKMGLTKTSTGYGTKIETPDKISFCGRLYRVYCDIYSNSGVCYITTKKHGFIYVS